MVPPGAKKEQVCFDVAQGSYDGAKTCDLVGLFLLFKLENIERFNNTIYRDGGLGVTCSAPRQVEAIKKKICSIFAEFNLKITAEANLKTVDFLDVILDLENESFRPFIKLKNIPLYMNKLSNHPPSVANNIPAGVNKRFSSISSDEKMEDNRSTTLPGGPNKKWLRIPIKI
jgi:hypothetical protein